MAASSSHRPREVGPTSSSGGKEGGYASRSGSTPAMWSARGQGRRLQGEHALPMQQQDVRQCQWRLPAWRCDTHTHAKLASRSCAPRQPWARINCPSVPSPQSSSMPRPQPSLRSARMNPKRRLGLAWSCAPHSNQHFCPAGRPHSAPTPELNCRSRAVLGGLCRARAQEDQLWPWGARRGAAGAWRAGRSGARAQRQGADVSWGPLQPPRQLAGWLRRQALVLLLRLLLLRGSICWRAALLEQPGSDVERSALVVCGACTLSWLVAFLARELGRLPLAVQPTCGLRQLSPRLRLPLLRHRMRIPMDHGRALPCCARWRRSQWAARCMGSRLLRRRRLRGLQAIWQAGARRLRRQQQRHEQRVGVLEESQLRCQLRLLLQDFALDGSNIEDAASKGLCWREHQLRRRGGSSRWPIVPARLRLRLPLPLPLRLLPPGRSSHVVNAVQSPVINEGRRACPARSLPCHHRSLRCSRPTGFGALQLLGTRVRAVAAWPGVIHCCLQSCLSSSRLVELCGLAAASAAAVAAAGEASWQWEQPPADQVQLGGRASCRHVPHGLQARITALFRRPGAVSLSTLPCTALLLNPAPQRQQLLPTWLLRPACSSSTCSPGRSCTSL